ncbi:MAG: 2-hydroxyacid dehydrogenase [Magnetovibrionaceae bacterium]
MTEQRARVLVTRKLPDRVEEALATVADVDLNPDDRLYPTDELLSRAEGVSAIVACHTERFSAEVIQRLPKSVKAIVNFSVGYDHVDCEAAKASGVIVTNTPDVLSDATAETAMLLMLGAARRAGEGWDLVRKAEWKDWSPAFMVGTQITGKRLGIVGMGRVGQVLADRARGFDMEIHYHNRSPLEAGKAKGATYHDSLDSLLAVSDVLSLHCPATPENKGLLNAERIAKLPAGAIVVNSARGAVIDDDALIAALGSGQVKAAGLDVFNGEPCDIHPAYRDLANVFVLPHIGSATAETRDAMGFRALENLKAVLAGTAPCDRVA